MKTVGKQLQDARVAKGWSPELAARETKIRVDRLHDLEVDDYSNFSSPTYARGFVRTYARALSLDEYKILRQLDNKLPEDDNASFVNDSGVPYMPEPSKVSAPFEVSRGVYVAGGVAGAVLLLIGFILVQSYRAGYFASTPPATLAMPATNALPVAPETETARAMPADGSAPPVAVPVDAQPAAVAVAPATTDTNAAPRALPVNLADMTGTTSAPVPTAPVAEPADTTAASALAATPVPAAAQPDTSVASIPAPATASATAAPQAVAAPSIATAPPIAPVPDVAPTSVTAETPAATVPTTTATPPRALPVDLGATTDATANVPAPTAQAEPAQPRPVHSLSARGSDSRTVNVAAADNATDSLIASTRPVAAAPSNVAAAALTGAPDNTPPATANPETSSPDTSAPSSLTPSAVPESTSALTGAPAASDGAPAAQPAAAGTFHGQRLVLTASHDSFVRVVALDGSNAGQLRYASTLHSGQSISFNDRKYSINVADASAIDIALDGINYGPHRDNSEPDTFTIESHTP